jgi:hypothetical protein
MNSNSTEPSRKRGVRSEPTSKTINRIAARIRQAKGGAGSGESSSIETDPDELQMAGFFVIDQPGRKK